MKKLKKVRKILYNILKKHDAETTSFSRSQPSEKNLLVGLLKTYGNEVCINLLLFMTLCCGILTIETSDCFFRSFCFTGQNGTFSTTE